MSSVSWVRNTLDLAGSHYRESRHPEARTAQEMAQNEHVSGHQVAKTVGVRADDKDLLLVLPASRNVNLEKVRELLGADSARLLNEQEVAFAFPDCEVGAVPPMRHWPGIDIWVDAALDREGEVLFAGGSRTEAIRMPFREWAEIVRPREESFSMPGEMGRSGPPAGEEETWRDEG